MGRIGAYWLHFFWGGYAFAWMTSIAGDIDGRGLQTAEDNPPNQPNQPDPFCVTQFHLPRFARGAFQ